MEDDKSKAVKIAEYQRWLILKAMTRVMDQYVNSVMLGSTPRDITYDIKADNMFSENCTVHPVAYNGKDVISLDRLS